MLWMAAEADGVDGDRSAAPVRADDSTCGRLPMVHFRVSVSRSEDTSVEAAVESRAAQKCVALAYEPIIMVGEFTRNACVNAGCDPEGSVAWVLGQVAQLAQRESGVAASPMRGGAELEGADARPLLDLNASLADVGLLPGNTYAVELRPMGDKTSARG